MTPSKYLNSNENLVVSNEVEIVDDNVENEKNILTGLSTIYIQRVNKKSFGLFQPRLRRYFKYQKKGKDIDVENKKIHWPTLYDSLKTDLTCHKMENYLMRLGYFKAKVSVKRRFKKNKAYLSYTAQLGKPFIIGKYVLNAEDKNIKKLLKSPSFSSFMKKGEYLKANTFKAEKNQIIDLLRRNGYAAFSDIYISKMLVDTISGSMCDVTVNILNPLGKENHTIFNIGDILINPSYERDKIENDTVISIFKDIKFKSFSEKLYVKESVLESMVSFNKDSLYDVSKISSTVRTFNNLEVYKYINLQQSIDTTNNTIDVSLDLYRAKRKEFNGDLLLNLTQDAQSNFRFGSTVAIEYKDRNFRNRANVFSVNGSFGFQLDSTSLFSRDIKIGLGFKIPRCIDGINLFKFIYKPLVNKRYNHWKKNTSTSFEISYTDKFTIGYLKEQVIETSLAYEYEWAPNKKFGYKQIGLEYISPDLLNKDLPIRIESYQKAFFTGFIFRDLYFASLKKFNNMDRFWRMEYDLSGFEVLLAEKFISKKRYAIDSVNFSHYFKVNFDGTLNFRINENQSIVFHGGVGLITNMGNWLNDGFAEKNPFSKQFSLGGNNSMRAWKYHELEPGGYQAAENLDFFTQTGDIRFELNLEWRFKLFWLIEGAAFVDVGNIWNVKEDTSLIDAEFKWSKAIDQLAVSSGFGLRFDVSWVILRVDYGFKTRYSYKINDSHFNHEGIQNFDNFWKNSNIQFAIDYPF